MKGKITILTLLIISVVKIGITQTYWQTISFPDTLVIRSLNAEKEGVLITCTGRQQGDYKGVFRSYDNGETWEEIIVDTTVPYLIYNTVNRDINQVLYLGTNGRAYRSFDDGNNFENILETGDHIFTINFNDNNDIYVGGWCGVIRSTDNGNTWDTICSGTLRYFSDIDFGLNGEIYLAGRSFVVGSGGGGFYRSLDNGITWENTYISEGLNSIAVENYGIINVNGYLISHDSGETWTINTGNYAYDIESNQYEELIAGYLSGVRLSDDWGENWTDISGNVSGSKVQQVSITPNGYVYLLIGFNQIYCSSIPVSTKSQESVKSIINVYPNPSNGCFYINPQNSKSSELIGVYNNLGKRISDVYLENKILNMTKYKNGLYTVIIKLDDEIIIKKIIKN
jgi:photosystem II stability/assembly factor-like uncharacterized protein